MIVNNDRQCFSTSSHCRRVKPVMPSLAGDIICSQSLHSSGCTVVQWLLPLQEGRKSRVGIQVIPFPPTTSSHHKRIRHYNDFRQYMLRSARACLCLKLCVLKGSAICGQCSTRLIFGLALHLSLG